jgi:poly(A) polymerase
MRILELPPGPLVGKAWNYLLELRLERGELGKERATAELLRWAAQEGISPPPPAGSAGS